MNNEIRVTIDLVREAGRLVFTVTDGNEIKYAWPTATETSLEVAKKIQQNWKLAIATK